MDKETYEALKLLMDKLERHVIHATYQEDAKEAYKVVDSWIQEVSKEYIDEDDTCNNCGETFEPKALHTALNDSTNKLMSFCDDCWNSGV